MGFVIGSLDPQHAATAGGVAVLGHVHDPLLRRDLASMALAPGVLRGRAHQTAQGRYVLDIDDRARFHDGSRVTADDVATSIRSLIDGPGSGGFMSAGLDGVQEAIILTEGQVELRTDSALPLLDERLSLVRVQPHSAVWSEDNLPHGTGPYRVVSHDPCGATLEPAPGYALLEDDGDHRSPLDLLATPEPMERMSRLLEGDVHVIEEAPQDGLALLEGRPDLASAWVRGMNTTWLLFNCADELFGDVRVRRAVALAMDREQLAHTVHRGRFEPSGALLPRWHPDYVACAEEPAHDLHAARALLRQAGASGVEIELLVSSADWVVRQAELVVEQLAAVGISARAITAHTADLFEKEIPAGRFQVLMASGDPSIFGRDGEFFLRWYLTGRWARHYAHQPKYEVDGNHALVRRLVRTPEPHLRRELLGQLQRAAATQCSMAVLGHRPQPTAWSRTLQGFRPSGTTGLDLRTAHVVGAP
ncbi:ABC transporter substrate-binding protein [Pedococcus sp. 5OH_020]|uniref:ABC transporter substrate-binding protein n=1 Tax=Pedococcus sp. 5OH_020 TaxID=2989814 RepID=UPI0022E9ACAD|nr:ABC transporter substrate-binding protein [Pedococcus sp. 5OH_020]